MFERGRFSPTDSELSALAAGCGVEVETLQPRASRIVLTAAPSSTGAIAELRGEAAFDALLREYVSMVLEYATLDRRLPRRFVRTIFMNLRTRWATRPRPSKPV